jgi:molybdopterin-guanine dinucleotide biosynthesis protein A
VEAIVAILAGGRSTRMGRPKAGIELAGKPLIAHPIDAARAVGLEPWVIAKPGSELPALDCRVLEEPEQPIHPLTGIVTALRATAPWPVLALGADMPFVEDKLMAWLASQTATAVAEVDGRLQPLLARYDAAVVDQLQRALEQGAAARDAVRELEPLIVGEEDLRRFGDPRTLCFNVNTPGDLREAERIIAARAALPRSP